MAQSRNKAGSIVLIVVIIGGLYLLIKSLVKPATAPRYPVATSSQGATVGGIVGGLSQIVSGALNLFGQKSSTQQQQADAAALAAETAAGTDPGSNGYGVIGSNAWSWDDI